MTLKSMTGFANRKGSFQGYDWAWEIKAVNAKGLDVRFRIPSWLEGFEHECRKIISHAVSRGSLFLSLDLTKAADSVDLNVNRAVLEQYMALIREYEGNAIVTTAMPSMGELLSLKGVVEVSDTQKLEAAALDELKRELLGELSRLMDAFNVSRSAEGDALGKLMTEFVASLETLVRDAEACDGARIQAIRERFAARAKELMVDQSLIDNNRLEQELAHLAVKADIREELDRLKTHIGAAHELLSRSSPVGREFDFLSQEFNREVNTLCSKSSDQTLTAIGLKMKVVVDQLREQLQNIE